MGIMDIMFSLVSLQPEKGHTQSSGGTLQKMLGVLLASFELGCSETQTHIASGQIIAAGSSGLHNEGMGSPYLLICHRCAV